MHDPNRDRGPGGGKLAIIGVPLMIICCAAPLIIASGALTGIFAWLSSNGIVMIGLAFIAGALGAGFYKARLPRHRDNHASNAMSKDR